MNQAEVRRRQVQMVSVILALCNIVAVSRLAGYNGVTYVAVAVEVYGMLWTVVSGGLTGILGRVLRLRNSKGQYKNAARMRRNALVLQLILGTFGSFAMLLGAGAAAGLFQVQYSTLIIMILAPSVLLHSLSAVLLGYFQGEGAELPAMASGILRQLLIFGFSQLFCRMLGDYGSKVSHLLGQENFTSMYGGVGVAVAISLAELFMALFLFLVYKGTGRSQNRRQGQDNARIGDSFMDSFRILGAARGIPMLIRLLAVLPVLLGLFFCSSLEDNAAVCVEYGVYGAGYGVLCGIPAALVLWVLIPVCGRTVGRLRREESRFARTAFQGGLHIGVVHGAFAAVFLVVLAEPFGAAVCPGQETVAAAMLRGGAAVVVLIPLCVYFARFLMLINKRMLVLIAMAVFDLVFLVLARMLIGAGGVRTLGLVYAGLAGLGVLCVMLGAFCFMQLHLRADWLQVLIIPAVAATAEGLLCLLLDKLLSPHMGEVILLVICLAVSGAVYWAALLLLRNFSEQELEHIPGGKLIFGLGQMLNVY